MVITPKNIAHHRPSGASSPVSIMILAMASLVGLLISPGSSAGQATPGDSVDLQIASVNRVYEQFDAAFTSVSQGPLTVHLRSPSHELTVHRNRLQLEARPDGALEAVFEAEIEGWGDLEVEVLTAFGSTPLEDRVVVGRQWVRSEATLRLFREPGGYELVLVQPLRSTVGIQIESDLARRLVDSCRGLSAVPMLSALDCDSLSTGLTRVQIPMPEPGTRYHVDESFLAPAERAIFDRFSSPR